MTNISSPNSSVGISDCRRQNYGCAQPALTGCRKSNERWFYGLGMFILGIPPEARDLIWIEVAGLGEAGFERFEPGSATPATAAH